jgi:hypothetical protein
VAAIQRRGLTMMMEAARTSETSVDIDLRTRQYIPEDSELHGLTPIGMKNRFRDKLNLENKRHILFQYFHGNTSFTLFRSLK